MELLAKSFAVGRVLLGISALAAPGPVSRAFGIGEGPGARIAGRYIGGRDLVLGVGMLLGARHGTARGWYEGAAAVDLLDTGITALAGATGAMAPRRAASVCVLAGGSALAGLVLARHVDTSDRPSSGEAPSAAGGEAQSAGGQ